MGSNQLSRVINAVIVGGYFVIKSGAILGLQPPISTIALVGTRWRI
jgi:hypothetical protein